MFYCTYPILYKCTDVPPQPAAPGSVMPREDKAHGSVSLKTYCLYFIAGGGYALLPFLIVVFLLAEVCMYVYLEESLDLEVKVASRNFFALKHNLRWYANATILG